MCSTCSIFSGVLLVSAACAYAQNPPTAPAPGVQKVPLVVTPGVPLRLYLTRRLSKRLGAPVDAKLLEPLFSFDRAVVPAGSEVLGRVDRIEPVDKMRRAAALLGGDFTPLHDAEVKFTTIVLPDGRRIPIKTMDTAGLNTIVPAHPSKQKQQAPQNANGGILGTGKRQLQAGIDAAKQKVSGIADMVRGPGKMERIEDFLITKLPYHPQWVRNGTRFDAELRDPLQFGEASLKPDALSALGTQPPPDSIAHVRLLSTIRSDKAKRGDPVQAMLSQPLFTSDQKLIFPAGSLLTGSVTTAHRARWLHRGGQLRFSFQRMDLPPQYARIAPAVSEHPVTRADAVVAAAESAASGDVKVDSEGTVTASNPKTRFIAPAISLLIANQAADRDAGKHVGAGAGASSNVSGRTLGGAAGFGLLGTAAAQASPIVGEVFGFYGLGWSVYSNLVAPGNEVEFDRNAAMDIRFGGRAPLPAKKFQASAGKPASRGQ